MSMSARPAILVCGVLAALAFATAAPAQNAGKKALVQKIVQLQQAELENLARSIVERPAAQMLQEAGIALQRQVAPEKRDAMGKAIDAEAKKYVDESYPLVRERALRIAPATVGAVLEEKMSEDELKVLLAWLESPVYKKYQQLGPELRTGFIQKLLAESQPVVDPKVQALDGRIRVILGLPPAQREPGAAASGPGPRPTPAKATGK